ncbi:MAG: phosphotransferase [Planctomycetota bacterium]
MNTSSAAPNAADGPEPAPGGGQAAADVGVSSAAGGASGGPPAKERASFAPDELAIVLSHYDLGVIDTIKDFPRGSRKAPKLLLRSEKGLYLLKRRARGKDDAYKVAFCHGLQLSLADRQFPLPHLIGTRRQNNSMLKWGGTIYELFEYIKGNPYDQSLEATADSGKVLSLFHKLLQDYKPNYEPPRGSYHDARSVHSSFTAMPATLAKLPSNHPAASAEAVAKATRFLQAHYLAAAGRVNDAGLHDWPTTVVHSDWHPGNMLFRGSRVVAVIDYDAARLQQRVLDAANGALQFSILGGGDDPATWPEYLDESRFKRFLRGYDSVPDNMLSRAELDIVPDLMTEALIAEAVIPIAATGRFSRMHGAPFLQMVCRKVTWLKNNAGKLIESVAE